MTVTIISNLPDVVILQLLERMTPTAVLKILSIDTQLRRFLVDFAGMKGCFRFTSYVEASHQLVISQLEACKGDPSDVLVSAIDWLVETFGAVSDLKKVIVLSKETIVLSKYKGWISLDYTCYPWHVPILKLIHVLPRSDLIKYWEPLFKSIEDESKLSDAKKMHLSKMTQTVMTEFRDTFIVNDKFLRLVVKWKLESVLVYVIKMSRFFNVKNMDVLPFVLQLEKKSKWIVLTDVMPLLGVSDFLYLSMFLPPLEHKTLHVNALKFASYHQFLKIAKPLSPYVLNAGLG